MSPPVLQLRDIALTFGGTPLLEHAELSVSAGDRICLVGRNGSGKSTLLKMAAGLVEPDRGEIFRQPGMTLQYLPQEPDFAGIATTLDYVEAGLGPHDDRHRARYLLEQFGLTGDEPTCHLSGGEARRVSLARVMAPDPDILLLDEPTNHLDVTTIEWLERDLQSRRGAIVIISHDRRFLTSLSRATVWLDRGVTRRLERGFADFEDWRDAALAEEERDRHKLDRKIAAEEDWIRYGVTARRKRNVRRVAQLAALRTRRSTERRVQDTVAITMSTAESSGALVIEASSIGKAYDGRNIVRDFSTRIERGNRVGIVGPNGSGKTTLISMLTSTMIPDSGTIRLGANVAIAALDQHRDSLDPATTVADALTGGRGDTVSVNGLARHVIGYMRDFLFSPEQARTPLAKLSGGERGRLMLAQVLAQTSNLLVLDEPTNDLDMETLDVLEDMLADYSGTILLISHDRDFLDRLVSRTIVPEGNGHWIEYAGGYSDMLAQRGVEPMRALGKTGTAREPQHQTLPQPSPSRARLTYKDKHALETLPQTIAALQDRARAIQDRLAESDFYARDRPGFEAASEELGRLHAEIAEAEERWLTLEMRREEIEGR